LARGTLAGKSFASAVQVPPADAGGLTTVDIRGTVSDIVLQVTALGGKVISQSPAYGTLRAALPLQSIETLANSPSVVTISAEQKAVFNVGALTSQGYISHMADAVALLGITGAGVKVGVLSDSASAARVAALIASGDLPANTVVLSGQDGASSTSTDEGTAMMEIVHDLAPGAQLFFATANPTASQFAANILALAAQGCSIIVDDVTYLNESPFQDGPIAQAVNTFVAGGGLYFSSAANNGNLTSGTSGTWEGDFLDGGAIGSPESGRIQNFSPLPYDSLAVPGGTITLKWSDPLGGSNNDYDLFVFDSMGSTLKAFSTNVQNGTQDPIEGIGVGTKCGTSSASGYCPAVGDRIVVIRWSGSPGQAVRALNIETNGGVLSVATTGATYGHNAGGNTVTVAATSWNSARTGTKAFTGLANSVEVFSSDGPRRMFYNPNGTAITPGNVLFGTNGGTTLMKPDITAADGTAAKTPGFFPFYGTSAAAPHAAAIAALVKSANPGLTNTQIKNILVNTALDNMTPGWDRNGGYGVVMALKAVQAAHQ